MDGQTKFDWSFALQWLVSCAVGTAIGGALAISSPIWSAGSAVAGAVGEFAGRFVVGGILGAALALGPIAARRCCWSVGALQRQALARSERFHRLLEHRGDACSGPPST